MGKSRRLSGAVMDILLVAGLAAIWILFAPVKLGGQVSYVLVNGISMLPNFHTDDLVLVRQASVYQVGDVVTYHDAEMNANIIHRIIGLQADHFVLKGDNNSWIDAYQPTATEILGKLWIQLPKFGATVLWVRTPLNLAFVASLLGGFFMVTMSVKKQPKNGRSTNQGGNLAGFEMALYLFGVLALGFLVLAIFALSRPTMQKAENIPYKQTGTFAYSAAGSAIVYNTGSAVSGEPVFTKLTCKLNLAFTYTMQGGQLVDTSGSQKLYALILDEESGWQRTIPLTAETAFVGNTTTNKTTLDLCQVAALVASMEQATGIHLNSYTLVIVAHVTMGGRISGQKFTTIFDPRLTFGFDGLHLYLLGNSSLTNPMQTVQSDTITNSSLVDNTFLLFGLKPSVGKIRMVALIGLGSSLAGLVALWIYSYSISRRSEESIIHLKYSFLLMGVHEKGLESLSPVIDVTGIEDLVKLAQRQNVMIMHLKHGDVHYYLVQVEGKTYRYMTGQGHNAEPGREQE